MKLNVIYFHLVANQPYVVPCIINGQIPSIKWSGKQQMGRFHFKKIFLLQWRINYDHSWKWQWNRLENGGKFLSKEIHLVMNVNFKDVHLIILLKVYFYSLIPNSLNPDSNISYSITSDSLTPAWITPDSLNPVWLTPYSLTLDSINPD